MRNRGALLRQAAGLIYGALVESRESAMRHVMWTVDLGDSKLLIQHISFDHTHLEGFSFREYLPRIFRQLPQNTLDIIK